MDKKLNFILCLILMMFMVWGCGENSVFDGLGNKETSQAKMEEAKIEMDKGNFSAAIQTLQELCGTDLAQATCDNETIGLLASAYSGRAGVNLFNLINTAALTATGTTNSFSTFSTLLPTPTESNKTDMASALTLLSGVFPRTPNQNLQLAVVAASHLVTGIGVDLTNGFNTRTGAPIHVPSYWEVETAEINFGTVTGVSNDLALIVIGVEGSGLTNREDLTDDITEIENDLDGDQNGIVTPGELQLYLATL